MELNVGMGGENSATALVLCAERLSAMTWICLPSGCVATTSARKATNSALVWRWVFARDLSAGNLQGGVNGATCLQIGLLWLRRHCRSVWADGLQLLQNSPCKASRTEPSTFIAGAPDFRRVVN